MASTRVILDFPGPHPPVRLRFDEPARIVVARTLAEVRPALQAAEQAARDGAWVAGFIAYEAAPAFDRAFRTRPHTGPTPLLWFAVFNEPLTMLRPVVALHSRSVQNVVPAAWIPDTSRADYDHAIHRIRHAIAAGDVYQVNHTLRFEATADVDPAFLYDHLVAARHGVYHALIETPDWAVVSASPELFFDLHDRSITTRPMKGTLQRGRWLAEDRTAIDALRTSMKDRAENLMIVDLLRNDLGRIAQFGSVHVESMFDVETYPTVHQLTSTIRARLRDDVGLDDVMAALFPCGSVTGAPKVAAMEHIAMLEHSPRGPYCGAIGMIRPDGTATFNVAIRTIVLDRSTRLATYGAGGGITWDSSAAAEHDEVVAKAALLTADTPEFDLLETMRMDDGIVQRRARHVDRITESALYRDFPYDVRTAVEAALDRASRKTPHGSWRLRLTASRDSVVRIERSALERDTQDIVHRVALARWPVDSGDRMLQHKTTARENFDAHRAMQPDAFDVLLYSEKGHVTEFTIGNIVCEIDGVLVTPPREDGLLPGTFRAELLDRGIIIERSIALDDLYRATRLWLINSVREWVPVRLGAEPVLAAERAEPANGLCPLR